MTFIVEFYDELELINNKQDSYEIFTDINHEQDGSFNAIFVTAFYLSFTVIAEDLEMALTKN